MKLEDKLTFGKYKGLTIKEVIEDNPSYLAWAIDTIDWFELDDVANTDLERVLGYNDDDSDWYPVSDHMYR